LWERQIEIVMPNGLAVELRAGGPSVPVPLQRDSPAAGVENAALGCATSGEIFLYDFNDWLLACTIKRGTRQFDGKND